MLWKLFVIAALLHVDTSRAGESGCSQCGAIGAILEMDTSVIRDTMLRFGMPQSDVDAYISELESNITREMEEGFKEDFPNMSSNCPATPTNCVTAPDGDDDICVQYTVDYKFKSPPGAEMDLKVDIKLAMEGCLLDLIAADENITTMVGIQAGYTDAEKCEAMEAWAADKENGCEKTNEASLKIDCDIRCALAGDVQKEFKKLQQTWSVVIKFNNYTRKIQSSRNKRTLLALVDDEHYEANMDAQNNGTEGYLRSELVAVNLLDDGTYGLEFELYFMTGVPVSVSQVESNIQAFVSADPEAQNYEVTSVPSSSNVVGASVFTMAALALLAMLMN